MKKIIFLTLAVLALASATVTAQDGEILKKNFNVVKGIPTIRLIGATPILNFGTVGGKIDFYNSGASDLTLTHSANTLTLAGGNLALGANNLTMTGSLGATGAGKLTKGWFTDLEITNLPTVNGTAIFTNPTITGTLALGTGSITMTGSIGVTGGRVTKLWAADAEFTNPPTIGGATMAKTITVTKTIGGVGVAGCDYNFATAANTTEQVINLGAIIPGKARIINVETFTDAVFTGATTLVMETGVSSSGNELISSASIYAADAMTGIAAGGGPIVAPASAAQTVYCSATPGANWSLVTAGKVTVYVTYIAY